MWYIKNQNCAENLKENSGHKINNEKQNPR